MSNICRNFALAFATNTTGTIAQVVEQWTENPCVIGSTPIGTTAIKTHLDSDEFFYIIII